MRRADVSPVHVLETERYDTADLRLAAAGISLAVVRGGGAPQWQLDLPDGDGAERLRVPATDDGPAGGRLPVPSELAELVRGAARKREVRPVGRVRTLRAEHHLIGDDDVLLGRVVHDHVTLSTMGRTAGIEAWTELTVEADGVLGDELAERIRDAGMRPATPRADAELARLLQPEPASRPSRTDTSAGGVLGAYLATQVERIAAADLQVRRGEPDSVHQLRVAARRLRSALQGHRPLLDRRRTDPLVDALRELGRSLAPARDAEVLRERITSGLEALPDELRLGPVVALTTRHFARAESEGTAAALATLDGEEYARLRDRLDQLVAAVPLTKRAARPAVKELPRHVERALRGLESTVRAAESVPVAERDVAVHAARKAGKRLRYVTEVARPAVGTPAKRFTADVKALQQTLGEHQDTVVARAALRELGAASHAEHGNGFSFGVLYGRDAAIAERIEAELPQLWQRVRDGRNRRWVK